MLDKEGVKERIEVFRRFQSSFKFRGLFFFFGGGVVVSTPLPHQMHEVGVSELKRRTEIGF